MVDRAACDRHRRQLARRLGGERGPRRTWRHAVRRSEPHRAGLDAEHPNGLSLNPARRSSSDERPPHAAACDVEPARRAPWHTAHGGANAAQVPVCTWRGTQFRTDEPRARAPECPPRPGPGREPVCRARGRRRAARRVDAGLVHVLPAPQVPAPPRRSRRRIAATGLHSARGGAGLQGPPGPREDDLPRSRAA